MQDNKKKELQVDKKNKSKSKYDTPLRTDAFELSDDQKIEHIKKSLKIACVGQYIIQIR